MPEIDPNGPSSSFKENILIKLYSMANATSSVCFYSYCKQTTENVYFPNAMYFSCQWLMQLLSKKCTIFAMTSEKLNWWKSITMVYFEKLEKYTEIHIFRENTNLGWNKDTSHQHGPPVFAAFIEQLHNTAGVSVG